MKVLSHTFGRNWSLAIELYKYASLHIMLTWSKAPSVTYCRTLLSDSEAGSTIQSSFVKLRLAHVQRSKRKIASTWFCNVHAVGNWLVLYSPCMMSSTWSGNCIMWTVMWLYVSHLFGCVLYRAMWAAQEWGWRAYAHCHSNRITEALARRGQWLHIKDK